MFEHYLAQGKGSWKRRGLIIVSAVIHGLAGLGLFVWSAFHVAELDPPPVTLTFFNAPPPPPPPPPPAGRRTEPKPKPKVTQPPSEIPKLVQPPRPEEPEEEEEEGGVEGGVPGGVPGGVLAGVPGGVLSAAPPAPKVVASFVLDGQRVSFPDPHLPENVVMTLQPGQALLGTYRICVGTDGRVTSVSVVSSVAGADAKVMEDIKKTWVYKPQPLPVCTIRNFRFVVK
jgi:protein TonB